MPVLLKPRQAGGRCPGRTAHELQMTALPVQLPLAVAAVKATCAPPRARGMDGRVLYIDQRATCSAQPETAVCMQTPRALPAQGTDHHQVRRARQLAG